MYDTETPISLLEKGILPGFQKIEFASPSVAEIATPASPIAAERASGVRIKEGIEGEGTSLRVSGTVVCAKTFATDIVNPSIKDALRALVTFLIIVFKVKVSQNEA